MRKQDAAPNTEQKELGARETQATTAQAHRSDGKLWGGRFADRPTETMEERNNCLHRTTQAHRSDGKLWGGRFADRRWRNATTACIGKTQTHQGRNCAMRKQDAAPNTGARRTRNAGNDCASTSQ